MGTRLLLRRKVTLLLKHSQLMPPQNFSQPIPAGGVKQKQQNKGEASAPGSGQVKKNASQDEKSIPNSSKGQTPSVSESNEKSQKKIPIGNQPSYQKPSTAGGKGPEVMQGGPHQLPQANYYDSYGNYYGDYDEKYEQYEAYPDDQAQSYEMGQNAQGGDPNKKKPKKPKKQTQRKEQSAEMPEGVVNKLGGAPKDGGISETKPPQRQAKHESTSGPVALERDFGKKLGGTAGKDKEQAVSYSQTQKELGSKPSTFAQQHSQANSPQRDLLPVLDSSQSMSQSRSPEDQKKHQNNKKAGAADAPKSGHITSGAIGSEGLSGRFEGGSYDSSSRFGTIDRGAYFRRADKKEVSFFVSSESDVKAWRDDYLINSYLLRGVVLKVATLNAFVYVFVDKQHEFYHRYLNIKEDGIKWKNLPNQNSEHIVILSEVEKVELYDNQVDGCQGFVCFMPTDKTVSTFCTDQKWIKSWKNHQRTQLLYEPTSIKSIYLDTQIGLIHKPESPKYTDAKVAAIVNPAVSIDTIEYGNRVKYVPILEGDYCIGNIYLQYGSYTMAAPTRQIYTSFLSSLDKALDIAEEMNAYVMVMNFRRTIDETQPNLPLLIVQTEPIIKLMKCDKPVLFRSNSDHMLRTLTSDKTGKSDSLI